MAKRIRLPKKQQNKMVKEYAAQLAKRTLMDTGLGVTADAFNFESTIRPVIKFSEKARLIIKELVQQCEKEIAWNGLVNYDADTNTYEVYDILIFPQIVTGTSVDVDETKYAMWLSTLSTDQLNHMRFHGHSHVNMGVGPSNVDTGYQKEMLQMQITDYYIFMIFNKREDMYACIYDVANNVVYENKDIDIEVESSLNPYKETVKGWITDLVEFKTYTAGTSYYNGGKGYTPPSKQIPTGYNHWTDQLIGAGKPNSNTTPGERMMQNGALNDPSIRRFLD